MNVMAYRKLQGRVDRISHAVAAAVEMTPHDQVLRRCQCAIEILRELRDEIERCDLRGTWRAFELADLKRLLQRLRELGREVQCYSRCTKSKNLLDQYFDGINLLQRGLQPHFERRRFAWAQ